MTKPKKWYLDSCLSPNADGEHQTVLKSSDGALLKKPNATNSLVGSILSVQVPEEQLCGSKYSPSECVLVSCSSVLRACS